MFLYDDEYSMGMTKKNILDDMKKVIICSDLFLN